jgi:hypothetical protein
MVLSVELYCGITLALNKGVTMTKRDRAEYYKQYYQENKDSIKPKQKEMAKIWRAKNKEELSEKGKRYYEENKDRILERTGKNSYEKYHQDPASAMQKQQEWKRNNIERYLIQSAKARAKKYGLPFEISHTDVVVPPRCPYLDIELSPFSGWSTPSLDKIVPELGYVKGNIQVISTLANTMKNQASIEQLLTFANSIIRLHSSHIETEKDNHERSRTILGGD